MKTLRCATLALLLVPAVSRADPGPALFPPTDELFYRLLADPRQAQTSFHHYSSDSLSLAEVALGNTWGIYRWKDVNSRGLDLQLNLEGMAYSQFKLSDGVNEFQTIDFFANIPVEARQGIWSGRVTLFHQSSHLGDDYIRRTNDQGFRYSVEGLRGVVSADLLTYLRLYGGGMAFVHTIPRKVGGGSLQFGYELRSKDLHLFDGRPNWLYLANDFSPKSRVGWNTDMRVEIGLRMGTPKVVRATRVHAGYYTGHSQFGQFYDRRVSYFDIGVSFDF